MLAILILPSMTLKPKIQFLPGRLPGFTLVELLIVMAILGLLVAVGASNFQAARIKARDLQRKSDLVTIAKSLEAYVNDYGSYPRSNGNGEIICQPPTGVCTWGAAFTDGGTKNTIYAATIPAEKNTNRSYRYLSSSGTSFTLYAALENEKDPALETFTPAVDCGGTPCNYKVTSSNIQ